MKVNKSVPASPQRAAPAPGWLARVGFTWLGVYPVLTLIAWILEPVLGEQSLWVKTLTMSVMMVPLMVVVVMPLVNRLSNYLYRRAS